jgi:hypothetical protein
MHLKNGVWYQCDVQLSFLESTVNNDILEGLLKNFGFVGVNITGWGDKRIAFGKWNKGDMIMTIDDRFTNIEELKSDR